MLAGDEKLTLTENVAGVELQERMRQVDGHASGGSGSTVFSSTALPSSHVSAGPSTTPFPQVCGFVVVVVVGTGCVVVVVVGVGAVVSSATRSVMNASTAFSSVVAWPVDVQSSPPSALPSAFVNLSSAFCRHAGSSGSPFFTAFEWQPAFPAAFFVAAESFFESHLLGPGPLPLTVSRSEAIKASTFASIAS